MIKTTPPLVTFFDINELDKHIAPKFIYWYDTMYKNKQPLKSLKRHLVVKEY